jgi:serine phosphatase RsbU (regulator of sigma subunit)
MRRHLHADSPAFSQALLKSEKLRVMIVLAVIGALFVTRTAATFFLGVRQNERLWLFSTLLLAAFLAYEIWVLRRVTRAIREEREPSRFTWIRNVIAETSVPALAIAFISSSSIAPAYQPLANPAVLLFFIFIILSTLRLDPMLCRLSGIVAAVSYLLAALYLGWRPSMEASASIMTPGRAVIAYAFAYILGGVVAGAVAGKIREHVNAALHEAESKRQVERLEHDLDVARNIQQSLLPTSMPQVEGFDIAAWNQPADQTGGDYYDWQPLGDGKVLVALADVTGHGIGPALIAAVCRAYARTNFNSEQSLLTAMERINSSLSEDLTEGRFITFVAAVCAPGSSKVELLSAGHGPLFFYALKHDHFDAMDAQGLPLGVSSSLVSDPPQVLDLDRGDILILATDGFFEWANAQHEQFGHTRLENTIRESREKSADEIISMLYEAVLTFAAGTPQMDDLTAIVVKRV